MNDPKPRNHSLSILLVLALAALSLFIAVYFRQAPSLTDPALLEGGADFSVSSTPQALSFLPAKPQGRGLVFYPGARVPPEAYAYLGRALAAKGHATIIARFPLGFAVFAPGIASALIEGHPEIGSWIVGGHSLGGAMAASWLHGHPGSASGLLLLASYPPGSASFADSALAVLSLSASLDGLATPAKIAATRRLLPQSARFVVIEGGNHAGFGDYGRQQGDGQATIDAARQRQAVVDEALAFIEGTW